MASFYLDASALVKRYLWEPGSSWVSKLLEQPGQDSVSSLELIAVEVVCALSRAERDGRIGLARRDSLASLFLDELSALLESVPVSVEILRNANQLALRHPLRAYDAMHLATALDLRADLVEIGLPAPIFVSADENLLAAARAEGLTAVNPNDHA
jgi:predicted nucleic acid-binding protein